MARCALSPNSPSMARCGCTTRLPPSAKARRRTRMPRSSRPNSRSTGRAPTTSSQLAPVPSLIPRTAPLGALSSYIWIHPLTCLARMLAGAFGTTVQALYQPPRPWRHAEVPVFANGVDAYVLNKFSKKSPPYHVAQDDISTPRRFQVEKIAGHQSVRGQGGVIPVMYETHWTGLSRPSWERRMDLQLFRHEILRYWAGTPNPHR